MSRRIVQLIPLVVAIDAAAVPEALLCAEIAATHARLRSPWSRRRVNELTAETITELLGILAVGKTRDGHFHGVATIRVRAGRARQSLAEVMHGTVAVPHAAVLGELHLVQPVYIGHRFVEFLITTAPRWSPRALDATFRERGRTRIHGAAGGVSW